MKLVSVESARAVWLISTNEFNPRGMNLQYSLLPAAIEKYKFIKFPSLEPNKQKDPSEGEVLDEGIFRNPQGIDIGVKLTIFADGIVAETRSSTSDTDEFLQDFFQWASEEFALTYQRDMVKRKGYVSELTIIPEGSLTKLDKFAEFTNKISTFVATGYTVPVQYKVGGIFFAADPVSQLTPSYFRLERKLNEPFNQNKYFSQAPLPTELHLEMLDELEGLLSE